MRGNRPGLYRKGESIKVIKLCLNKLYFWVQPYAICLKIYCISNNISPIIDTVPVLLNYAAKLLQIVAV